MHFQIIIEELSGFSVEEATDNGPGDGLDDRWKTKNETLSGKEISKHS